MISLETFEGRGEFLVDELGVSANLPGRHDETEFGGEEDLVAVSGS